MAIASTRPTTAFTYRDITLQDRLREVAREVGDKPALLMGDRSVTFREIDQLSDRLAAALAKRGVRPGDRVTIFMPNSVEFVIAFYGTLKAGGVVNPINSQSKEREVRFQVGDSGATAVLYHAALAPVVDAVRSELKTVRAFAVTGETAPSGVERFDDLAAQMTTATCARRSAGSGRAAARRTSQVNAPSASWPGSSTCVSTARSAAR